MLFRSHRVLNFFLTANGILSIDREGTLRYEPGVDGRLLGVTPYTQKLGQIRKIQLRNGEELVIEGEEAASFRGEAVKEAYIWLKALQNRHGNETPFSCVLSYKHRWQNREGLALLTSRGLGFTNATTRWVNLEEIWRISIGTTGLFFEVSRRNCKPPLCAEGRTVGASGPTFSAGYRRGSSGALAYRLLCTKGIDG